MNKKIYTLFELMNELVAAKVFLVLLVLKLTWLKLLLINLSRKARVRRRRTSPKENVSIVVRKDIGRGIVQNSRLPIIRV